MAIGMKLKTLLTKENLKVTALSKLTDIPVQTIYAIIRRDSANVDFKILRKICTALEVNISYFYHEHVSVQSDFDNDDISNHITFSVIDLPSTAVNEKHYDIATNNVVLSLLENMAEEQGCSPTTIIENILTEQINSYAIENEMDIVSDDENDIVFEDDTETTDTRRSDLPYWMF